MKLRCLGMGKCGTNFTAIGVLWTPHLQYMYPLCFSTMKTSFLEKSALKEIQAREALSQMGCISTRDCKQTCLNLLNIASFARHNCQMCVKLSQLLYVSIIVIECITFLKVSEQTPNYQFSVLYIAANLSLCDVNISYQNVIIISVTLYSILSCMAT